MIQTMLTQTTSPTTLRTDDRGSPVFGDDFLGTLEYLHIVARKILSGQMKAERRSRTKGVSVEFADHRPYSPGDDFRFIDWSIFLRTEQLFLKLFEEEEDLHSSKGTYLFVLADPDSLIIQSQDCRKIRALYMPEDQTLKSASVRWRSLSGKLDHKAHAACS
jgi:hypothetical protein